MDSIANQIANIATQLSELALSIQSQNTQVIKTKAATKNKTPSNNGPKVQMLTKPKLLLKKGHKGAGARSWASMEELTEIVEKFLLKQKAPVSRTSICDSIGFGPKRVLGALFNLSLEGKVKEVATPSAIRYRKA